MKFIFIISVLAAISLSGFASAEEISGEILQIKMNRIYFSAGEEENIFKDCSYTISKSEEVLYEGYIEASYHGISYSYPIENISDAINIDSCTAIIQPAKIDSLTPINIGILKSIPYGSSSNFPGLTSIMSTTDSTDRRLSGYGNILHTYFYDSDTEMLIDFESGVIDAFISYKKESPRDINTISIHSPAPFYAALIPNISKAVNNKGFMTTSLYYRFNEKRLTAIFEGDKIEPYYCLFPDKSAVRRLYNFSPENGRSLLNYLEKKPKKLFIFMENSSLELLGLYFGDILSRDKIRVKFIDNSSKADIYLKFIPLNESKIDSSLIYILDLLKSHLPDDNNLNSTILEIREYLELSSDAVSSEGEGYYLRLAQRSLTEDLGVFPLLRPSLFFTSGEILKGCRFDNYGRLDLSNLRKVLLPVKPSGIIR